MRFIQIGCTIVISLKSLKFLTDRQYMARAARQMHKQMHRQTKRIAIGSSSSEIMHA